jgi:hypothetical protein
MNYANGLVLHDLVLQGGFDLSNDVSEVLPVFIRVVCRNVMMMAGFIQSIGSAPTRYCVVENASFTNTEHT